MSVELPEPVAAYFAADKIDGEAVARCFTEDAVVRDEGRTHEGAAAIRRWKDETSAAISYISEPLAVDERDGSIIVTAHVTGSFPGSPVDLRYFFTLRGDRIAALAVIP
ncbi:MULTISPECIES: nuclear transport factor 2 family protein [unclassified Sphingomonas]|uniref:nuclear transport factor 2 family protein n=1 Tax=unclassified Sphingomonas TaxID=196159 RepID=UPI0006FB92A7|nr:MULTISPECIES: nuclear transport factor 2 family protein [unclassified Sphingomonas]KQX17757.1 polyketide cyclase [Sphingomonas sp. Root1294]KQY70683.1 polyketide cyclase [Sphingomonas sp. Root50]KRB91823.1 polyketide cyclase [Sphingomonas sp. Root720]